MPLAVNATKSQAVLAIVCQKPHSFFDVIAEGGGETDVLKNTLIDQYIEWQNWMKWIEFWTTAGGNEKGCKHLGKVTLYRLNLTLCRPYSSNFAANHTPNRYEYKCTSKGCTRIFIFSTAKDRKEPQNPSIVSDNQIWHTYAMNTLWQ